MKNTIAVIADSHLPDRDDTVKEVVFDWALTRIRDLGANIVIAAGDMTSMGTPAAARRVRAKLDALGLPFLCIPGNAELRTDPHAPPALAILKTPSVLKTSGVTVFGIDNSRGKLSPTDRRVLQDFERDGSANLLLAMHVPLEGMALSDRTFLEELLRKGVIGCIVAGHSHRDSSLQVGKGQEFVSRGLDPDKAIGGPPAMMLLEWTPSGGGWSRRDIACPFSDLSLWTMEDRREFIAQLGLSCMNDTLGGLSAAAEQNVECVEIRFGPSITLEDAPLQERLNHWRRCGGRYLSIHFPDIRWDERQQTIVGIDDLKAAVTLALTTGANAVTWHVPRCTVAQTMSEAHVLDRVLEASRDALAPLMAAGIRIVIENLHMTDADQPTDERGFGYLPAECLSWIKRIKADTGYERIDFILDVGHARNNVPYSSLYCLSDWYAELGTYIGGYHIHQVDLLPTGRLSNHHPITSVYGPLISFSSLFMAWQRRQVNRAPMFLEIRSQSAMPTLEYLRKFLMEPSAQ